MEPYVNIFLPWAKPDLLWLLFSSFLHHNCNIKKTFQTEVIYQANTAHVVAENLSVLLSATYSKQNKMFALSGLKAIYDVTFGIILLWMALKIQHSIFAFDI